MPRFEGRSLRPWPWVALLALLLCGGCQTAVQSLFTVSGAEWRVRQGQATWRPRRGYPELGGELVLAADAEGRCWVDFSKTPMEMVMLQVTRTNWLIRFPAAAMGFTGKREPPRRFVWLYLPRALAGQAVPPPLRFEREPAGGWRLENTRTGEYLEGFLEP